VSGIGISVVMGVFNGAERLEETIDSVLAQTERNIELVLVNDGSTDQDASGILSRYQREDSRIRVLTQEKAGLTQALIGGCAAATGKYIARIDVGDVMLPERLEKQRAVLDRNHDVVLVTCWTECCGPEWEPLYTTRDMEPAPAGGAVWMADVVPAHGIGDLLDGPTHHGSVMIRADLYREVGGYRSEFYYGQDWDLWYRLAERGKFAGVQDVLYRCRIFPEGISMQNVERQRQIHACSRGAFLARRKGENENPFLDRAAAIRPDADGAYKSFLTQGQNLAAGYYFVGEALRRNGDRRCRKYIRWALCRMPFSLKLWVRLVQSLIIKAETLKN